MHLQHRQIGELGIWALASAGAWPISIHCFTSAVNSSTVMPVSVATRIFTRSSFGSFAIASRSPDRTVLNGSTFFSFGLRFRHRRYPIQAVHHLRIHRMLDPERAVLIEGGDPRLGRHELRGSPVSVVGLARIDDRRFGRTVIP